MVEYDKKRQENLVKLRKQKAEKELILLKKSMFGVNNKKLPSVPIWERDEERLKQKKKMIEDFDKNKQKELNENLPSFQPIINKHKKNIRNNETF